MNKRKELLVDPQIKTSRIVNNTAWGIALVIIQSTYVKIRQNSRLFTLLREIKTEIG